ncbi:hypothetical protein COL10_12390 [Bacillus cereus]|nr:hypothetical protein CN468_02515 [Bacillus cereus]PFD68867.1 hypothetical protein CN301_26075 [Bacillus cereus]PFM97845.1 hypothetical protein COJ65_25260 [Bacillus cereus]PFV11600.1 hypothetical protein COL10_12390 [Bacillus cereus]PGK49680.1 hypothetical protein CN909_00160 [Bacillus cereus]
MILLLFLAFLLNYIIQTDDLYLVLIKKDPVMYSGLRNTNSYGLRLLSETKFLIIHGFSYKIKLYIRVLKEIWILKSVDEGMRDTNFKESYSKYVFYSIKASLCIMLTVVLI